jgi:branched chain amino acid efflux pump
MDDHPRSAVLRDALGIGVAVGAFGLSYGAVATASGFSVLQTCALSVLMFTGASQFALVGVVGAGGSAIAGAMTALLLGSRNALYGLRLSSLLRVRGARRAVAAQLVIDESTAMALARGRRGFWATGLAVFACWNAGTALGAIGGAALADPRALGLDAAAPAAFLALLHPRLRGRPARVLAIAAAVAALVAVPLAPAGVPVLVAAVVAIGARD